jgi:RNA polymerase sigma-70 factor (ECF subfamily)
MSDAPDLPAAVMDSWHRFLDGVEQLRPELYRYCRYLTRSPWDAEDLAQDALARAFVTLGTMHHAAPASPRAWLFRVASNLWIDRMRRSGREVVEAEPEVAATHEDPRALREAAASLIGRLSPQERAAVVLKDVFDLTLDEIAAALTTTTDAVKAALKRGRGKLAVPDPPETRVATPAALDEFCDAFNARSIERLTALLLDSSIVEIVGVVTEYGPEQASDPYRGSFAGMLSPLTTDERGGISRRFLEGYSGGLARAEVRSYRGEPIVLFWYAHAGGDAVRGVARVQADESIRRLRNYFFTPDVIGEVCRELDVPFRVNGYRYWNP